MKARFYARWPGRATAALLAPPVALLLASWLAVVRTGPRPDAGPLPVVERSSGPPQRLPCRLLHGATGSRVQLGNDTAAELPRGARIAWATTGTPAPQGRWHPLAQPLAPGQQLAIRTTTALHGSGCIALLLR